MCYSGSEREANLEAEEEDSLFLPFTPHRSEPISRRHGKREKFLQTVRVAAGQPLIALTAPLARTRPGYPKAPANNEEKGTDVG